jgi:hypothetical protein
VTIYFAITKKVRSKASSYFFGKTQPFPVSKETQLFMIHKKGRNPSVPDKNTQDVVIKKMGKEVFIVLKKTTFSFAEPAVQTEI